MGADHLLVRGGTVVDGTVIADEPTSGFVIGAFDQVGSDLAVDGATEIDASDALVTPGFIDTHAHTDLECSGTPASTPTCCTV